MRKEGDVGLRVWEVGFFVLVDRKEEGHVKDMKSAFGTRARAKED
jgi:hypothetical protein